MTRHQRQLRRRRHRPKARNKVLLVLALIFTASGIAVLSLIGYIVSVAATAPDIDQLTPIDMASELESRHSKTWILWQYLNDVPYGTIGGRSAIGIEAASQIYFSKDAKNLTLPEAAMIAGLPQAPSQYNPFLNPTGALERRNAVLQAMASSHYITQEDATAAATAPP